MTRFCKKLAWGIIGAIFAIASLIGAVLVGVGAVALFFHATGRIEADFEQAPLTVSAGQLVIGLALLIGGYKGPKWMKIDRLLL